MQISWVCRKQTAVSHTEAELISIDVGLRMEGTPALNFLDSHRYFASASPADTPKIPKTAGSIRRHRLRTSKRAIIQHANGMLHLRR